MNNPIKYKDFMGMGAEEKGKEEEEKKKASAEDMKKFEEAKKLATTIYSTHSSDATNVVPDNTIEAALGGFSKNTQTAVRGFVDKTTKANNAIGIYNDFTGKMGATKKVGGGLTAASFAKNLYNENYSGAVKDAVMWGVSKTKFGMGVNYGTMAFQGYAYLASKTTHGASQTSIYAQRTVKLWEMKYYKNPSNYNLKQYEKAKANAARFIKNYNQVSKQRK